MITRLQKKCVLTAAGIHLLLFVILIVGPAFLSSRDSADDLQVLEFVPMMTTDKPFSGGGNPKAAPPPPAPVQQQQVQPRPTPPPPTQKAAPPPEPVKKVEDSVEPTPDKRRKIEVSTTLVKRSEVKSTSTPKPTAAENKAATERANAFKSAASRLRSDLSSATEVDIPGPGGGGPTYARFKDALYTAYMNAWILPTDLDADAPSVGARVVIARDGSVISARIIKSTGIPSLDRSVQDALDRVKFIAPLPEGSGAQRECNINFNPLAKQSLG